jgi:hypothetical protein
LKGGKDLFWLTVLGVPVYVGELHSTGPGIRQNIMEDEAELPTSWQQKERKRPRASIAPHPIPKKCPL